MHFRFVGSQIPGAGGPDWPLTGIQSRWPGNQPKCVRLLRVFATGQDRTGQGCADVNRRIKITFSFVE